MGKASSSKKVARAARAGGGPRRAGQRRLAFPVAVFAVVAVGVMLVVLARGDRRSGIASAEAPTTADHWHAAYGFYICDTFLAPLSDVKPDTTGIHTHQDGVIHIHPFSDASTGKNATLGRWGEMVGVEFGSDSFTIGGTRYADGHDCNGQPGTVVVYEWPADDLEAEPEIHTSDFGRIRLDQDRAAITIAVVPEGAEVPRPPSVPTLDNLSDVPGATTTTSAAPGGTEPSPAEGAPAAPAEGAPAAPAEGAPPPPGEGVPAAPAAPQ
jgi:hypothetical protein